MALKKRTEGKKPLKKRGATNSDPKARFHELEEASKTKGFVPTKKQREERKASYARLVNLDIENPKLIKTKWSGFRVIRPEDAGVRLDPVTSVPNTVLVLEGNRASHLVTIMPDDLRIAWSSCGRCSWSVFVCKCPTGSSPSRSVEYIYDKTVARLAGEEWDHTHPNYRSDVRHESARKVIGSNRRKQRVEELDAVAAKKPLRKSSGKSLAKTTTVGEKPRKTLSKAVAPEVPTPPRKSLRKASSPILEGVARGDFSAADVAAADVAEVAIKKMLKKSGKKPLRKRSS